MGGSVEYMTGAQLQSAIQAANQAVSGMTFAEAQAALNAAAQSSGGGQVSAFPLQYQQYGQVTIEAQYAAQLWEYWKTVAGANGTTVLGAAAGSAVAWAQGALMGTGQGLAATAGILTLSVPTAVAMAAPLMGVGLGAALYETNPQLWTNIANGLVNFVNEGTETVTAFIDEAGHVLLESAFVQKLKSLFEENDVPVGIQTSTGTSTYEGLTFACGFGSPTQNQWWGPVIYSGLDYYVYQTNDQTVMYTRSDHIEVTTNQPYHPEQVYTDTIQLTNYVEISGIGRVYYYTSPNIVAPIPTPGRVIPSQHSIVAEVLYKGTHEGGSADYPAGTSEWSTPDYSPSGDLDNLPEYEIYDPQTQTTRPYYPTTPYVGDTPGTSVDPATTPQQNPTDPIPDPEWNPITPFIPPIVSPEIQWPDAEEVPVPDPEEFVAPGAKSDPIYVPEPVLDPATNPATEPQPLPEPETSDPKTGGNPPSSIGFSPPILFPVPDVPFPTISPNASETPVPSGDPGFVQVYHPSPAELVSFGRWLWVTYADATIDKIWNNPFDGVIGCHELYATPTDGGYTTIRCGFLDSGISSQLVRIRYSTINCGSMVIPEYWSNYLDYSPYSKAYIYLPFIGIQELDVDDIVGASVNVCYHIDAYNGSCIAQITCAKDGYTNTLYQFSGNCAVEYPLSGGSQAAIKAAMMTGDAYQAAANTAANATMWGGIGSGLASAVGGVTGGVATGLTGNIAGGISHGISGIASGIGQAIGGYASSVGQRAYGQAQHTASMLSGKSIVQHSGNFGASYGAMGIKKPYIFIRRPIQKVVNNYNVLYGYPAHKQVIIGNCEGFLRCREVHVVSPLATDGEKAIIEQLLTTGVYVTDDFS